MKAEINPEFIEQARDNTFYSNLNKNPLNIRNRKHIGFRYSVDESGSGTAVTSKLYETSPQGYQIKQKLFC